MRFHRFADLFTAHAPDPRRPGACAGQPPAAPSNRRFASGKTCGGFSPTRGRELPSAARHWPQKTAGKASASARKLLSCIALALTAGPAAADGEPAGEFDYYVMALSWSPNWCEIEGDARGSDQCDARHDHGWILHGLWPQYHQGWPSYCPTAKAPPSRKMTADMADIMGTSGLAWHQWKKHGSCSGLSATDYYALSRQAYGSVTRPAAFRKLPDPVTLPASLVEDAFLQENPGLEKDGVTVTCRDGYIQEVRVCLSRDLQPVPCGRDVIKDCTLKNARFTPVR